jgi:hypothetical protein
MMARLQLRWSVWIIAAGAVLALAPEIFAQPSPPPEAIRQKATEVFDRPEFKPRDNQSTNWLLRKLRDFFIWLGTLQDGAPVLFWVLLISCILALLLMLALIGWQVRSVFVAGTRARAAQLEEHRRKLSVGYREEARRFAAAGEYTEAIRFLFLSLVYLLDESGRVSLHKAYTNREYLDLLGDRLPARESLRIIVDILDDHWYGQQPCQLPQYEACLAVYERLVVAS